MDVDLNDGCSGGDQQPPPSGGGGGPPDLTADLLQRFSCMNTTDRDVLVEQLKRLLGEHINDESAVFWLDMNNWNLQAAICSYFDYEQPSHRLPSMKLVSDVTIGEGEEVPPNSKFTKTWRIANSGEESWPPGCCLRFTDGDQMCHNERVLVEPLSPGDYTDVSVDMISPQKSGIYSGQWRMSTSTGQFFGEIIWVIITVSEGGLLAVTQQMSRFSELGSASPFSTPFGAQTTISSAAAVAPIVNTNPFATSNQIQTNLVNNYPPNSFETNTNFNINTNNSNNNCFNNSYNTLQTNQNQTINEFSSVDDSMTTNRDDTGFG